MSNTSIKNVYINSANRTTGLNSDFTIVKSASTFSAIPKRVKLLSAQIPMTWKNIYSEYFMITESNNNFQLITLSPYAVYNISIPIGTYLTTSLNTAIQNALNTATGTLNYTVTYNSTGRFFTITNTLPANFQLNFNFNNSMNEILGFNNSLYPPPANVIISNNNMQTNIIVTGSNNKFQLTTISPYANYNIVLTPGTYTTQLFAFEVRTQLNAAFVGADYFVKFNNTGLYYTISSTSNFELNFTVADSASSLLGFEQEIYPTPETSFTAPNIVPDNIEITATSNKFAIIRNGVSYPITIPVNDYDKETLLNEIYIQLVAALIPVPSIKVVLTPSLYYRFYSNLSFILNFNVADSIAEKIGFVEQVYPLYQNSFSGSPTLPFMFDGTNNKLELIDNYITYSITITIGNYDYETLADHLVTLLNNVANGYIVTAVNNKLEFANENNFQLNFAVANTSRILLGFGNNVYPNNASSFTSPNLAAINEGNNRIEFNANSLTYVVSLNTGWYTPATIASTLQTVLNSLYGGGSFTVVYTAATFSYTITKLSGVPVNFIINFNIESSAYKIFGFNKQSYSGAAAYTSVNIATDQPEQYVCICSSLVGGIDNGIISWPSGLTNVLAMIPINTTTGNKIFYTSTESEPWQDMRESSFSKILLPTDSTSVTMQFSINFVNGNFIDLNGAEWSANLLLEF